MADSLKILSPDALRIRLPRNRLLGGLCLALSLSALLWIFAYYIPQRLSV